ncbi:ABC transporter ATP-binding protein [Ampullimonas aquatilis]|uniref:ABC transporter ATP-binding protein n=1 Tax=Ampullimonas aquatilis TaxID=1341549 RepID=UPI003C7544B4
MKPPLIALATASKTFTQPGIGWVKLPWQSAISNQGMRAVDQVSLAIAQSEVLGLVGESGCGKSTLGRMLVGLQSLSQGQRLYEGMDMANMNARQLQQAQLAMQMIFQDPAAALNPRLPVRELIGEAPRVHGLIARQDQTNYVADLLGKVGLDASMMRRYVHQFSGGQKARIGIARALAVQPRLLVCDESVAALDVSVQAQILNLFADLRDSLGLTYLFISHNLAVVRHLCDRVAVMYLGRIVEQATVEQLFSAPRHPYTQGLLAAAPTLTLGKRQFVAIKGEIASPLQPPSGCHFHPRCPLASQVPNQRCQKEAPRLQTLADGSQVACHLIHP